MPARVAFHQSAWLPAAAAEGALTSLPPAQSRHPLSTADDTEICPSLSQIRPDSIEDQFDSKL